MTEQKRKELLRKALKANDISPDWKKWLDSQSLGQAVKEALR